MVVSYPSFPRGNTFNDDTNVSELGRVKLDKQTVLQDPPANSNATAEKLVIEGDQLRTQGSAESLRKALVKYESALPLWRSNSDALGEANTLDNLGLVYSLLGENHKALENYHQALALWRTTGDRKGQGRTLNNIAFVYLNTADREKALTTLNEALPLRRSSGDREGEAATLNGFGVLYHGLGESNKAIDYFQQALNLRRSIGDKQGEAQSVNNIGAVYFELGENDKALEYYQLALPLRRATGDRRGEANTLYNIGGVYSRLDEFQKALTYYDQTLAIWRGTGDRRGEAITLNSIGALYSHLDDRRKAISYYELALPLFRAITDRRGEAQTLDNIGLIRARSGDLQGALSLFEQSLVLRRAIKDRRGEAFTLGSFGGLYFSRGEFAKALDYHQQALTLRRALGERGPLANTLNQLGAVFTRMGVSEKATASFQEALELWREVKGQNGQATSLAGLARLARDRGDLKHAREQIEAALTEVEALRFKIADLDSRATLFASKQDYYEFYVGVLMSLHDQQPTAGFDSEAFQAAERSRARNWLDNFSETHANIRAGVDANLLQREKRLAQQLNTQADRLARLSKNSTTQAQSVELKRSVDRLITEYQEVQAQIRSVSPNYAALVKPEPVNLKELQQQVLDEHTALLAYSLGQERSYLWTITRASVDSFALPGKDAIQAASKRFYELLTQRNETPPETLLQKQRRLRRSDSELKKAASDLGQMLIGPVASGLIGKRRLLIVAEGPLLYVPFAALPLSSGTQKREDRKERLLVSDYEIVSLPSASILKALYTGLSNRSMPKKTLAVFADPVFENADPRVEHNSTSTSASPATDAARLNSAVSESLNFTRLRFSRQEAEQIASLAAPDRTFMALGFDANREVISTADLGQYRFLHFATHTVNDTEHPELSGIVLSLVDKQGRPTDGFIRLHEIYNLNLNAELVVLSACRTALGKEIKGEGIVGLTRGFMYAGSPRVVASIWSVQDKATSELMMKVYRNVFKRNLSPAAALREAQLSMLQDSRWNSPYYWAAFSVYGLW